MRKKTTSEGGPAKGSNVIPFPNRIGAPRPESDRARKLREMRERKARAVEETIQRRQEQQRRQARGQEAYKRAVRMKLRRIGHPAPPARPAPPGDYCVIEVAGGAVEEFGYPSPSFLLIRRDAEPRPGEFVMVEREQTIIDGRPSRLPGDDGIRLGILGRHEDGSPRLESLTCGAYSYKLKRVVGKVVGPVTDPAVLAEFGIRAEAPTPAETPDILGEFLSRANTDEERTFIQGLINECERSKPATPDKDWPEYINVRG